MIYFFEETMITVTILSQNSETAYKIREFIKMMLTELNATEDHIEFELNRNNPEKIKRAIKDGEIIVAKESNEIVGFVWFKISGGVCNISKIYVKETYRRRGIATMLIKKIIEIAKENNCHKIIGTVRESNTAMQKLMEKLGFIRECYLRNHFFGVSFYIYSMFL